jgi:putative ATPase
MSIPLADRMRPQKLSEYIGQKHILAEGKLLRKTLEQKKLFSMILWGPPGVGKTTLARLIANETGCEFLEFSAVTTGIAEIKKVIEGLNGGKSKDGLFGTQLELGSTTEKLIGSPVVFIDEIHRFNKAQQDAFLPLVESGKIVLIGATTENPSFEIIAPLLSRARVFVLQQLSQDELKEVVERSLKDEVNGFGNVDVKIEDDALDFLIEGSNGDGRRLLNSLEIAVVVEMEGEIKDEREKTKEGKKVDSGQLVVAQDKGEKTKEKGKVQIVLTKEKIEEALQHRALGYDKGGEEHYNTISAFIKSMRASNPSAALYYLARMVAAGEDALFIARRMVIFSSEDIGMAQPTALVVANEVFKACETIGYPECQINLAHGVVYLASATKDRSAYDGYFAALADVKETGNLPIPLNLRNAPTKLMKNEGYGKGYEMYTDRDLLPEALKGKKYFDK